MLLEGIFIPLTTPFHPDGRLFLHKLETNVERYSRTPAAGMLVAAAAGEGAFLSDLETAQVFTSAITAAADHKVMIAGVTRPSVRATLELAESAARYSYDVVAVSPPDNLGESERLLYLQVVADRSPLPILILGPPGELAGHPQVIGALGIRAIPAGPVREVTVTSTFAAVTGRMLRHSGSAGSFVSAESLGGGAAVAVAPAGTGLKTRTRRVGFQTLAGSTDGMLQAWDNGATGALPWLAACAPQACCEVWQAFKDGDAALAAEKQERVRLAGDRMEGWSGIAALKYGCDLNAYFGGTPRLPLLPLRADHREAVERLLGGLKN
jgi:dihydrodipicolinate synthase/N-acetylneuraminate lyase